VRPDQLVGEPIVLVGVELRTPTTSPLDSYQTVNPF